MKSMHINIRTKKVQINTALLIEKVMKAQTSFLFSSLVLLSYSWCIFPLILLL